MILKLYLKGFGLVGIAISVSYFMWLCYSYNILGESKIKNSIHILDRHNKTMTLALTTSGDRSIFIPLAEIPDTVKWAFIISEDKRFYDHSGVDVLSFFRALFDGVIGFRKPRGASTIPMQYSRILWPQLSNLFLKPLQCVKAISLTQKLSKGALLEGYLNLIPFARQTAGVETGARLFFGKSVRELSLAQAAMLAVIPRNPKAYSLASNPESIIKRNNLINKMSKLGLWDNLSIAQALDEPLKFERVRDEVSSWHVIRNILDRKHGLIENGNIKTTIDLSLQRFAEKLLFEETRRNSYKGDSGAILVVDNNDGSILAYVGSPDFFNPKYGMVDNTIALRSPGSALKPFLYALALERGYTLSSVLPDLPISFKVPRGVFSPRNYSESFSGHKQIRYALANSQNIPALYMASVLGEALVLEKLHTLGFSHLTKSEDFYGVGLALGNGEVTLQELVKAYVTLARLGMSIELKYLVDEPIKRPTRIFSEKIAYLISEALSDPIARSEEFGRGGSLEFDFKVAAKTGTSSQYRDHWAVGYTAQFTVGVWRGNADGHPIASKIPAAMNAGDIMHDVMVKLYESKQASWLHRPSEIVSKRVCSLSGELSDHDCEATREELFVVSNQPNKKCPWHKSMVVTNCGGETKKITYVDLPSIFSEWAETGNLPTRDRQLQNICGIVKPNKIEDRETPLIAEPHDEAIYAFDTNIPISHQQLRIVLDNTFNAGLFLYVNDHRYIKVNGKREVFWPMSRGKHKLELRDKDGKTKDLVSFRVY
ncbi:MAG: penicillin-binding protein 1C [Bdellovibrionales bacterium RIFOXYB1_FULL_37_110]|nr:MAG: penicillin-binding protein 1C [Bdellovibrionales bacterium RIFOXYC1_FULL_37_79]OFZ57349.1 MAG: penicillin-binding protein 1C [Bdellovibrionales bacterium RIFOXYB1_FULL_37_110]OFZ62245.1 MAG: penicillin-binding protein 1C [Bdellovibrionales bacterium RIFOXYD1_FULL_36_51]